MSITALRPSALSAEVEAARASVRTAGAAGFAGVGDDELASVLVELTGLVHQAESLRVQVLAEAQDREVADRVAASGTDAWAAALTGEKRHVLRGGLWLAERLASTYPATREAFAAGRLGFDQAMVIVRAAEQAPADATPAQVAQAEEIGVAKATGDSTRTGRPMSVARLRQAVRRMFATIDPELADRHEAALLGRQERAAENETWFSLGDNGNGTWSGKFTIPDLHGQLLKEALERLTAPRRLNRPPTGETVVDPSAPATGVWEKWGAGFCELLEHLPTAGWSHSASAGVTMLVTIDLERLRDDLGAAGLDGGARVSAGEARRLACEAGIVPVVLDGESQPLDLGRESRLFTTAQRKALAVLHDTCGIESCERPYAWRELHHQQPWSHGGATDLADAVPLCGYHHRRAHDGRFVLGRQPGGGWRLHPRR